MDLVSIFKRDRLASDEASSAATPDAVQEARIRARQRLIGAVVLVAVGIIGFPLLFETQPRPIPVDIPIEIPRRENSPALSMPIGRVSSYAAGGSAVTSVLPITAPPEMITELRDEAGRAVTIASPVPPKAPSGPMMLKPEPKPAEKLLPAADPDKPTFVTTKPVSQIVSAEGNRVRSPLDGKPLVASMQPGRFVVQVGAFVNAGAARETRLKAERLGLKTYMQVASTSAGSRVRVRLGPFGDRAEAERALAKAKGAGLSAVVLSL